MTNRMHNFCVFCVVTGAVLPWGLILFAGALGIYDGGGWLDKLAAYSAALGLFFMALSFFLARFLHWLSDRG